MLSYYSAQEARNAVARGGQANGKGHKQRQGQGQVAASNVQGGRLV